MKGDPMRVASHFPFTRGMLTISASGEPTFCCGDQNVELDNVDGANILLR